MARETRGRCVVSNTGPVGGGDRGLGGARCGPSQAPRTSDGPRPRSARRRGSLLVVESAAERLMWKGKGDAPGFKVLPSSWEQTITDPDTETSPSRYPLYLREIPHG